MYAIYEFKTNYKGIMTDTLLKKTDSPAYAQSDVLKAASALSRLASISTPPSASMNTASRSSERP